MKQVLLTRGGVIVDNVPAPLLDDDGILVEVAYSFISVGTEMSGVNQAQKSFVKQAVEQPEKVKKLIDHFRQQGVQKTIAKVREKVDTETPLGYSCSGVVIQVGKNIKDIEPGQRVACAGAGKANHAEIVLVPRNLIVQVPEGCRLRDAASVTLGAIAMQGVRQADPRLGEIVAVIGLGLLGQITVQLLAAAGCRVIGLDLDQRRVDLAKNFGLEAGLNPTEVNVESEVRHLTEGHGVDATIITAASQSDAIVQQSMEITRKKGRVVVVGAVGLGLKRSPFYEKELDFLISCSYGPGRYEPNYEDKGLDYPYAYVRWTENRNMIEYLRLVAENKILLDTLVEREYDIDDAPKAYKELQLAPEKPLGVFLRYPLDIEEPGRSQKLETRINFQTNHNSGKINVAIIGAGAFAKGTHLPNLQKLSDLYHIRTIVSATGSNAKSTAQQFGADYATTSFSDVLDDELVDMVLISTRHHLHASQSIAAAKAGKAIFLEKPMALNQADLEELVIVLKETRVPFVVGFNRRFSPAAQRAKQIIAGRKTPLMIYYRMNAGYLPPEHWTQTEEGGGRMIGEGCHIFDLFQYLIDVPVTEITATPITTQSEHILSSDNMSVTLRYEDGSVATLLYTALGSPSFGKEYMELYTDGKVLVLDDYRNLQVSGTKAKGWTASSVQDKGHLNELRTFATYVHNGSEELIPLDSLYKTTKLTFLDEVT